jgi:hypothetical protein
VRTGKAMKMVKSAISGFKSWFMKCLTLMNNYFNSRTPIGKKVLLLIFGVTMGGVSFMLIIQAFSEKEYKKKMGVHWIKKPNDIYMNEQTISEDDLMPVGKLKGEIDGEFEAFYLAVDVAGKTYINRSIAFSKDAYHKSKGWEEISKAELDRYQRELHFLPARTKGLKH